MAQGLQEYELGASHRMVWEAQMVRLTEEN